MNIMYTQKTGFLVLVTMSIFLRAAESSGIKHVNEMFLEKGQESYKIKFNNSGNIISSELINLNLLPLLPPNAFCIAEKAYGDKKFIFYEDDNGINKLIYDQSIKNVYFAVVTNKELILKFVCIRMLNGYYNDSLLLKYNVHDDIEIIKKTYTELIATLFRCCKFGDCNVPISALHSQYFSDIYYEKCCEETLKSTLLKGSLKILNKCVIPTERHEKITDEQTFDLLSKCLPMDQSISLHQVQDIRLRKESAQNAEKLQRYLVYQYYTVKSPDCAQKEFFDTMSKGNIFFEHIWSAVLESLKDQTSKLYQPTMSFYHQPSVLILLWKVLYEDLTKGRIERSAEPVKSFLGHVTSVIDQIVRLGIKDDAEEALIKIVNDYPLQ